MESESSPESPHSEGVEESARTPETEDAASSSQKPTRRRTKTGCITCRKRRIKCGEERPVCANCIKSRRRCEGYRPPIVFRRSIIDHENQRQLHGLVPIQSSTFQNTLGQVPSQPSLRQQLPIFSNQPDGPQYQVHFTNTSNLSRTDSGHNVDSVPETARHGRVLRWTGPASSAAQEPVVQHNSQNASTPKSVIETNTFSSPINRSPVHENLQSTAFNSMTPPFSDFDARHNTTQISRDSSPKTDPAMYATSFTRKGGTETQQMLEDAAVEHGDQSFPRHWSLAQTGEDTDRTHIPMPNAMHQPQLQPQFSLATRYRRVNRRSSFQNDPDSRSLDHYRVGQAANPLNNANTAKIFSYYRAVTAPMMCPWSRNPSMTAEMLHRLPVPILARNFFAYTVPILALQDQGLLHALLALTSLHIAKDCGMSPTPALKHYSWSLKRVHQSVRNQTTRLNVATLTATIYLSMYEIMTADHGKWNTHLNGASQLMKEISFAELTSSIYALKRSHQSAFARPFGVSKGWQNPAIADEHLLEEMNFAQINDFDEDLIRKLSGTSVVDLYRADTPTSQSMLSTHDVQFYPVLQDIFWWFVKIDLIRAIIGGSPPMLCFQRIFEIPPRTAFHEQAYGASDHLHILLARLVDFSSRDRARKIKVADDAQASPPLIQFYGLAPYTEQDRMPSAFRPRDSETTLPATSIPEPLETDLESANIRAMKEWNDVKDSFVELEALLSVHYPSISDEGTSPNTPFGRPLIFETYQIGCLWAHYYMACIILHRLHPLMPPQHTLAIGLAARQTAGLANSIGRIAAGMRLDRLQMPHRPISTAAFAECSMPLFVAGVQFQDTEQRRFLIARMEEIERLTGRASVGLQAKGCEVVWQRAHAAGRGPRYDREDTKASI